MRTYRVPPAHFSRFHADSRRNSRDGRTVIFSLTRPSLPRRPAGFVIRLRFTFSREKFIHLRFYFADAAAHPWPIFTRRLPRYYITPAR